MATYTGRDQRLKYLFQNGGGGGGSCKVISGYYHNGDFYEDQSYTQIITGDTECLYIDLDTTTLYLFDGTDYVEVQGGGGSGGGGFSSDTLFSGEYYDESTSQLLSDDYTDYDYLLVEGCAKASYYHSKNTILIQVSDIGGSSAIGGEFAIGMINPLNSSFFWRMRFSFPDGTHIKISDKNLGGWTGDSPMITKVLGLKSIPKHTYSTTEQVVGTWIDGKPIYEVTVTASVTNPTQNTLINLADVSSLAIDSVCDIRGVAHADNGTSFNRWLSEGINLIFQVNVATGYLVMVQSYSSYGTWDITATLRFTKSTT